MAGGGESRPAHRRRGRQEQSALRRDIVADHERGRPHEDVCCARGEMENQIEEQQVMLFADRTSATTMRVIQLRLDFLSVAYLLLHALRQHPDGHGDAGSLCRPRRDRPDGRQELSPPHAHETECVEGWDRDRVTTTVPERGMSWYPGSCWQLCLEKVFDGTVWRPTARLPVARAFGETSLMFLVVPDA